MSSVITKSRSQSPMDDQSRFGGVTDEVQEAEKPEHPLDSEENLELLAKVNAWFEHESVVQAPNRRQMALDCDYYDDMQWSEDEAQVLMDRNQAPLVFNEIKPTVNWLLGTERRTRIDHKVLPRQKGEDAANDAENKTMLLKYLSDVNKTPFQRSMSFDDCIKAGVGWLETGIKGDTSEELLYTRKEDWRNCTYDSNSTEPDYSDARYFFRSRWLDEDIAIAYFPERAELIRLAAINGQSLVQEDDEDLWYMGARVTAQGHDFAPISSGKYMPFTGSNNTQSNRQRVKLKECWYKVPVLQQKFNSGQFDGQQFNHENPEHVEAMKGGYSVYDKLVLEIRCAIFCTGGLLFDGKSPYKHGRIPFVPVWCYRRKRDNAPYGVIRTLRDPQDDLNKRRSKAQWIMSSNRVTLDEGAVEDLDQLREEVARPDSIIVKKKGYDLQVDRDLQLAQQHLDLMSVDVDHIRNVGGVNSENLGRHTNATSGVAITARQEQGSVATTAPFDNLRYAVQLIGEMELSNIEQFYTASKKVRIVGAQGGVKFREINEVDPLTGAITNDITAFTADFVVREQDYKSSMRQAMTESLFDMIGRIAQINPQAAMGLLDLAVDMADISNKDAWVSRIRKLNGQTDPDKEETPEEAQQRQDTERKQQEKADMQDKLTLQTMEKQLAKLVAETDKLDAGAMQLTINAMYEALQAAGVVSTIPAAAQIADEILKGAGYKDKSIDANTTAQAMNAQPALPVLAQAQPMQVANPKSALEGVASGIQTPQIEEQ